MSADGINYALVLNVITSSTTDPAEALRAFVEQECENAAYLAIARFKAEAADAIEAIDPVEWALAGQHAGNAAARIVRNLANP